MYRLFKNITSWQTIKTHPLTETYLKKISSTNANLKTQKGGLRNQINQRQNPPSLNLAVDMHTTCLICGTPITVTGEAEINTCSSSVCVMTVENAIGLHYQSELPKSTIPSGEYFTPDTRPKNGSIHL